jgi:hypothetical protein
MSAERVAVKFWVVLFVAAAALFAGRPLVAQQRTEKLPCPDCNPPKRFWPAFGELMIAQAVPSTINHLRGAEWAMITPATWATNLENPWQWDNNKFLNNQFSHPYHGNLYFNSARTNGYNFWESAPWAFGGSLMWEEFGEAWAPAPNDWYNTSLGGITLGEMLYRLSTLTLDNTATGTERVFRELGATLLNPALGFNRLVRGEMNDVTANPPGWRPTKIWGTIDGGYQTLSGSNSQKNPGGSSRDQGVFALKIEYGDVIEDLGKAPFSSFYVEAELTSNASPQHHLSDLRARGSLAAKTLARSDRKFHELALFMTYEYISLPGLEYGGQGFMGGVVSRFGDPKQFRVETELLATAMPVAALQSDYYVTEEGRDYDYGLGFGGFALARAVWGRRAVLSARGRYLWIPVLSGFNGDHYQASGLFEGRAYLMRNLGVGAALTVYHRSSNYEQKIDVTADGTRLRLYGSYSFGRGTR